MRSNTPTISHLLRVTVLFSGLPPKRSCFLGHHAYCQRQSVLVVIHHSLDDLKRDTMRITATVYLGFIRVEWNLNDFDFVTHLLTEENIVLVFPVMDVCVVDHYEWFVHNDCCMYKGTPAVLVSLSYKPWLKLFQICGLVKFGQFFKVVIGGTNQCSIQVLSDVGALPASRDSSDNYNLLSHGSLVSAFGAIPLTFVNLVLSGAIAFALLSEYSVSSFRMIFGMMAYAGLTNIPATLMLLV